MAYFATTLKKKSLLKVNALYDTKYCSNYFSTPFMLSTLDCWRTSNAGAWMSNAILRFFSLAEQHHTHEFLI